MEKKPRPTRTFDFPIELSHDVEGYPITSWRLRAEAIGPGSKTDDFTVVFHDLINDTRIPCDKSRIEEYPTSCQLLYEHFIAMVNGYDGLRQYLASRPPILN